MTRTERATSPRAIIKDRSESKSGIDKHTPKNGAGPHNWGSLHDELELEASAEYDENLGAKEEEGMRGLVIASSFLHQQRLQQPARWSQPAGEALQLRITWI